MGTDKNFTPGPWTANGQTITKSNGLKIRVQGPTAAAPEAWEEISKRLEADATLIASAPSLLTENTELKKEVEAQKAVYKKLSDAYDDYHIENGNLKERVRLLEDKLKGLQYAYDILEASI